MEKTITIPTDIADVLVAEAKGGLRGSAAKLVDNIDGPFIDLVTTYAGVIKSIENAVPEGGQVTVDLSIPDNLASLITA